MWETPVKSGQIDALIDYVKAEVWPGVTGAKGFVGGEVLRSYGDGGDRLLLVTRWESADVAGRLPRARLAGPPDDPCSRGGAVAGGFAVRRPLGPRLRDPRRRLIPAVAAQEPVYAGLATTTTGLSPIRVRNSVRRPVARRIESQRAS